MGNKYFYYYKYEDGQENNETSAITSSGKKKLEQGHITRKPDVHMYLLFDLTLDVYHKTNY